MLMICEMLTQPVSYKNKTSWLGFKWHLFSRKTRLLTGHLYHHHHTEFKEQ